MLSFLLPPLILLSPIFSFNIAYPVPSGENRTRQGAHVNKVSLLYANHLAAEATSVKDKERQIMIARGDYGKSLSSYFELGDIYGPSTSSTNIPAPPWSMRSMVSIDINTQNTALHPSKELYILNAW